MRGSSERGRRSTEPSCPLATITSWQRGEGMFLQGGPWCFQGTVGFWPDPASPESCLQTTPVFQVDIACPDWQAHSLHFACLSCWNSNFNLAAFLFFPLATINGVDSSPKPKTHVKNVKNTSKFLDVTSSHIHKETKAFLNTDMKTFRQKGVKDPLNQTKSTRWVTQSSSEYSSKQPLLAADRLYLSGNAGPLAFTTCLFKHLEQQFTYIPLEVLPNSNE